MMTDQKKVNIDIKIAGEPIRLTVPFERQNFTRDVEAEVNNLFMSWRKKFPNRTEKALLAMLVYQFASHYKDLSKSYESAVDKAERCLTQIESGPDKIPSETGI